MKINKYKNIPRELGDIKNTTIDMVEVRSIKIND